MNNTFGWDDLRLVLAVERAGSLSGAARTLGVSHATVFRRLAEIEARTGARLFNRSRSGYAATPVGEEAAAVAARMESQVHALERQVIGRDLRLFGRIRVTTTDTLLHFLLAGQVTSFRGAFPDIDLDIAVSNEVFDLSEREADIAIRPSASPPDHLVGRRLGTITQSVYARRDLAAAASSWTEETLPWVGPDDGMPYRELRRWLSENNLDRRCRLRIDSILAIHAAVREGAGVSVLPDYAGGSDRSLVRLGEPIPELSVDLWVLTHRSHRRTARIRAFTDFIGGRLKRLLP